jgi:hypothetical protein
MAEMGADIAGKSVERKSESGVFCIFLATRCESVGPFGRRLPTAASDGSDALTQHYRFEYDKSTSIIILKSKHFKV